MALKKFFCTDCEGCYVRRVDFEAHFDLLKVRLISNESSKGGGGLVDNPCYKRVERRYGLALQEARSVKSIIKLPFRPAWSDKV